METNNDRLRNRILGFRRFRLRLSCDWGCTMMGRRSLLLSGAAITGLVIAGGFAATWAATVATVGQPAPGFAVTDTSGRMRRLDGFKGKTVVLVWTRWSCPFTAARYTKGVMPVLQKWATDRGVIWLSVLSPIRRF